MVSECGISGMYTCLVKLSSYCLHGLFFESRIQITVEEQDLFRADTKLVEKRKLVHSFSWFPQDCTTHNPIVTWVVK